MLRPKANRQHFAQKAILHLKVLAEQIQ